MYLYIYIYLHLLFIIVYIHIYSVNFYLAVVNSKIYLLVLKTFLKLTTKMKMFVGPFSPTNNQLISDSLIFGEANSFIH